MSFLSGLHRPRSAGKSATRAVHPLARCELARSRSGTPERESSSLLPGVGRVTVGPNIHCELKLNQMREA
jgi:hypothetical protein